MNQNQETNIQVVVRIRPRNERERKENSPVWITTPNALKGKELNVKMGAQEKTYTFDRVFGADVDQETVFSDVVSSMLDEVLLGYNCTIFAYGQTGSGKTYTMEGDLTNVQGLSAGIIPRTLYQLFNRLESDTAEYSFRVSYVELYNEELKDLLSTDDDARKLRIYDDNTRKGSVIINGLEEVLVKNADDVIAILQKGANKRQTASTKMNEFSSRSHCIFAITVHIKECTADGEELVKIGKLNLVDLAGSENVGRSGAINQRAKEAGMINQSLLTLGRVINALVDRSQHIPYRESRLTRLLQDSLGGKTKTCIVANVSPARCNIEESISTLDYAHRAKNIRNKPEINQKMTKRALIREYVTEIERLKADLIASRDKNGIFLSKGSYDALMEENTGNQAQLLEYSKSLQAKEEIMQKRDAQFKESAKALESSKLELKSIKAELSKTSEDLESTLVKLDQEKETSLKSQLISRVHAASEMRLHSLSSGLVAALDESLANTSDLGEGIRQALKSTCTLTSNVEASVSSLSDLQTRVCDSTQTWSSNFCKSIEQVLQNVQSISERSTKRVEQGMTGDLVPIVRSFCAQLDTLKQECGAMSTSYTSDLTNIVNETQAQMSQGNQEIGLVIQTLTNDVESHVQAQSRKFENYTRTLTQQFSDQVDSVVAENNQLKLQLAQYKESNKGKLQQMMSTISDMFGTLDTDNNALVEGVSETLGKSEVRQSTAYNIIMQHVQQTGVDMQADNTNFGRMFDGSVKGVKDRVSSALIEECKVGMGKVADMGMVYHDEISEKVSKVETCAHGLRNDVPRACESVKQGLQEESARLVAALDDLRERSESEITHAGLIFEGAIDECKLTTNQAALDCSEQNNIAANFISSMESAMRQRNVVVPKTWMISASKDTILERLALKRQHGVVHHDSLTDYFVESKPLVTSLKEFLQTQSPNERDDDPMDHDMSATPSKSDRHIDDKIATGMSKLPRALKRSSTDTPFQSRLQTLDLGHESS